MSSQPRYILRDPPNQRHFYDVNNGDPEELRVSTLRPRSYDEEHQRREPRYNNRQPTPPPKPRICCSAACIIGLIIGLTIGLLIAAAVSIPLGLIKRPTPPFVQGSISTTPNWVGTFQVDSACDSSTCCCLTNQISLATTNSNSLQLNGSLTGRCVGAYLVSYAQTTPTNFVLAFVWYGQTLRVILSQDSSYLALVYSNVGYCSGTALRTSYSMSRNNHVNLSLMISILFIIVLTTI